METKGISEKELRQLIKDVAMIKEILAINNKDPEGELSNWAKKALEEARKRPEKEYVSLEEVRKRILSKKR